MPQVMVYNFHSLTTETLARLRELSNDGFQYVLWRGPQGTYILSTEDIRFNAQDYRPVVNSAMTKGGLLQLSSGTEVWVISVS